MAKEKATLLVQIKTTGAKSLDSIKKGFESIRARAFIVVAALTAVAVAIGKLALDASRFKEVERGFRNLAAAQGEDADKMLANMKRLSAGTISDLKLMQQANNALLLGLPVERFGDMLRVARSSAKATGQSMEFMLNSIVTGIGRSSRLMLDNLGIIVDTVKANEKFADAAGLTASKLTDAQKKQAFMNEALRIGLDNTEKLGASTLTLADMWDVAKAKSGNLAVELGKKLIPMMEILASKSLTVLTFLEQAFDDPTPFQLELKLIRVRSELQGLNNMLKRAGGSNALVERSIEAKQLELDAIQKVVDKTQEEIAAKDEELAATKVRNQERADLLAEEAIVTLEVKKANNLLLKEEERLFKDAMKDIAVKSEIDKNNEMIRQEEDQFERSAALAKKDGLRLKAIDKQRRKEASALFEFKRFMNSSEVRDKQQTFGTIASLATTNSKFLNTIGKAAALANITINTARGIGQALGAFPPPISFIMAGLVATAGAVQAAKVNGVQLADGGIVRATPGGIQATIGEGGRDEAVIPLDEDGRIGPNVTFNFQGPFLGDQAQAREFAIFVDEKLLEGK